jgi:hypothetical protein
MLLFSLACSVFFFCCFCFLLRRGRVLEEKEERLLSRVFPPLPFSPHLSGECAGDDWDVGSCKGVVPGSRSQSQNAAFPFFPFPISFSSFLFRFAFVQVCQLPSYCSVIRKEGGCVLRPPSFLSLSKTWFHSSFHFLLLWYTSLSYVFRISTNETKMPPFPLQFVFHVCVLCLGVSFACQRGVQTPFFLLVATAADGVFHLRKRSCTHQHTFSVVTVSLQVNARCKVRQCSSATPAKGNRALLFVTRHFCSPLDFFVVRRRGLERLLTRRAHCFFFLRHLLFSYFLFLLLPQLSLLPCLLLYSRV